MALTITLQAAATAAAQFLGVLDSGEGLSTQQLTDAFNAANSMLDNWTIEQVRLLNAILPTFSLAGGTYTPGSTLQFVSADNLNPITPPQGYVRAIELGLAIELAPQYDMQPSAALLAQYKEARAAASPLVAKIGALVPETVAQGAG